MTQPCPCHSGKRYETCCQPWHQGKFPPHAEQLMRSRYAAYALGLTDYLIQTTHPNHPDGQLPLHQRKKRTKEFSDQTEFLGLEIVSTKEDGDLAQVTFRATLKQNGHDVSFQEQSTFHRKDGCWLYLSGVVTLRSGHQ